MLFFIIAANFLILAIFLYQPFIFAIGHCSEPTYPVSFEWIPKFLSLDVSEWECFHTGINIQDFVDLL